MPTTTTIELEAAKGIETIALDELLERYGSRLMNNPRVQTGSIQAEYQGNLGGLLALQTINAAYVVDTFDIPRPKALLGHQHFTRIAQTISEARQLAPTNAYTTIHISAAGSKSSVMNRLLTELAQATKLTPATDEGDLLLRVRPSMHSKGWDVLTRLSPRPSATRDWRVVNLPGALNAAVANVMVRLSDPTTDDRVINLTCGSGTLAIERLLLTQAETVLACDIDETALQAAQQNIAAANLTDEIQLRDWDATDLPMSPGSIAVVFADLPFGNLTGSHADNVRLYPAVLKEAARVTAKGGRFVLITHEITLMDAVIRDSDKWKISQTHRVGLSGLHPRIYVLLRI